jgi:hypothetical protein
MYRSSEVVAEVLAHSVYITFKKNNGVLIGVIFSTVLLVF